MKKFSINNCIEFRIFIIFVVINRRQFGNVALLTPVPDMPMRYKPIYMRFVRLFFILAALSFTAGYGISFAADNRVGVEGSLVEKKGPAVTVSGTSIELWSDEPIKFEIFSITGQLIKSVNVPASTRVRIELPKGFYIVKCESWTRRIMVK